MERKETKAREIDALIECMDEFGVKNGTIITYDKEGEEEIKDMKILYISLRNWLLEFKNVS